MPDEQAQEPVLEIGETERGSGAASTFFVLTIIIAVLFVGFLIFWHYRLVSLNSNKQAAFAALQEQLNDKTNKEAKDQADSVTSAVQILSTAAKSKYLFRAFIDQLDSKITNDTKLNSLSIDNVGKVSLDGESASYRSVADLALALSTFDKLANVSISNLSQTASGSASGKTAAAGKVTFSISATIKDWKVQTTAEQASSSTSAAGEAIPTVGGL